MKAKGIRKLIVSSESSRFPLAQTVLSRLKGVPVETDCPSGSAESATPFRGTGCREVSSNRTVRSSCGERNDMLGKDVLHLVRHPGEFFKPCPGTREYICCGYQILNLATNCPLNCSYCILQAYFSQPHLKVFVNLEEALNRVLSAIDREPGRIFRVGTGEFTDSLALDPVTSWTEKLFPEFSRRRNAVLELKTKTDRIQGVLASKHRDRIIISWSLNSPLIAAREEHGAAGLRKRLECAALCQREGFVLGFHFDPMIPHSGWREGYLRTLDLMDKLIDPKGIIWISLGAFRYMPSLKRLIRARHPGTRVLDGEFIVGLDGKMRYFKPIRIRLYRFMRQNLQSWHAGLAAYLCMESGDVWERSMGWSPATSRGLACFLDRRVAEVFGGNV